MRKPHVGTLMLLVLCNLAFAQKNVHQLEINPFLRMDWYPEFSYTHPSIRTHDVNIRGLSWGLNVNYKLPIAESFFLKPGIGYYKHSFNHISKFNTSFGKSRSRNLNYQSPLGDINFHTDKYWYNTLSINFGFEKAFLIKKDMQIISGINLANYFTYSQKYHLTVEGSFSSINPVKEKNKRFFGMSAAINFGILKKIKNLNIGPSIILPVYDKWGTDQMFPTENNEGNRDKLFRGFGVGLICNIPLTKNK